MNTYIFALLLFSLFLLGMGLSHYALKYYRQKKYARIAQKIERLFNEISPFHISQQARQNKDIQHPDLTYGEIVPGTLLYLLDLIAPAPNALFYDLGSGCGKAVMTAKLRYPSLQAKGIELLPELHHVATLILSQYLKQQSLASETFGVSFVCGNILSENFSDADVILLNASAISPETWQQILNKLVDLKKGAHIIVTSKELPALLFHKKYQGMEFMSWGLTTTYIYEKMN